MDFSYLLDLAKRNEEYAKEAPPVKRYSTNVSASKKEPKSGVQSDGIRKFLARKEQEEKEKLKDELKKKEKLLSLRAQDRKSNARVQAMLKRTKAANKAVLDEAINSQNTAITAAGLDVQPDEDDYGYVSHEASEYYKKLMDKYNKGPAKDLGSNQKGRSQRELKNAKDRVKDALHKIEEEEGIVHRRRRTKKNLVQDDVMTDKKSTNSKEKDKDVIKSEKKSRPKGPPPPEATLSFDEILRLAAAKQHEPVKIEKKVEVREKKSGEPERLMTRKEKEEKEKELQLRKERQLRKEGKLPPLSASVPSVPLAPTKSKDKAIAKPSTAKDVLKGSSEAKTIPKAAASLNGPPSKSLQRNPVSRLQNVDRDTSSASRSPVTKTASPVMKNNPPSKGLPSKSQPARPGPPPATSRSLPPSSRPPAQGRPNNAPPTKGKTLAPAGSRPFPPYREMHPPSHHNPYKRPYESDEEEEEDSELDDFIDDGPEDGANDYSKAIQEMFNYDRSRYRRIESDDDDCMETSYAQQMKEERISAKIGLKEDLEELEREEEEKKMKMLSKKGKKRK